MTETDSVPLLARGPRPSRREQEPIALVAQALPAVPPYGIWPAVELITSSGDVFEIDLLALGHHALYLIDIKHWRGQLSEHGASWSLTAPDKTSRIVDDPMPYLRRLAHHLKLALVREDPTLAGVWIEPLVFVPNGDLHIDLPPPVREGIVTPQQLVSVLQRGELPQAPGPVRDPVDETTARAVMQVLDRLRRGRRPGYGNLAEEASRLHRNLVADLRWQTNGPTGDEAAQRELIEEVALAWVVSCAFVRALEERGLLERSVLLAEAAAAGAALPHADQQPSPARDELIAMLTAAGRRGACAPVLAAPHNPIWRILPSDQGAGALLAFFWPPDNQRPRWTFGRSANESWTTLYQDLSQSLRETYGWVVTPGFVGKLLLAMTLVPVLDERGPETVRVLDPACGSGTLLVGAFEQIFEARQRRAPGADTITLALAALDQVHGVDISPGAALIARIRLTLAFLDQIDPSSLAQVPEPPVHVSAADALLMESDAEAVTGRYQAVVCTPTYLICKDAKRRDLYRERYASASMKFSLSAPFIERCFQLAAPDGLVGILSSNSFMKREFGKRLVEEVLSGLDLTKILDTSGAFLPGFGTPTLILIGRNRPPQSASIRVVSSKGGEPIAPVHPEEGRVWSAIAAHHDEPGYEDDHIAVADVPRAALARHPWHLTTGEPAELREALNLGEPLAQVVARIETGGMSGNDAIFTLPLDVPQRLGLEQEAIRPLVRGASIRDWAAMAHEAALVPHTGNDTQPLPLDPESRWANFLWRYRALLQHQVARVPRTPLATWWSWRRPPGRSAGPSLIGCAIARSNEFAWNPGHAVQNTALVVELPASASDDDAFALLSYLNSSTACYWLKHHSSRLGGATHFGSSLRLLPVPGSVLQAGELRTAIIALARRLHGAALERTDCTPERALAHWNGGSRRELLSALADAQHRDAALMRRMVCDQEDLDWSIYAALGLVSTSVARAEGTARPEHRPFAWLSAEPPVGLDPRLLEVWTSRRQALECDPALRLLENTEYKRRFRDAASDAVQFPADTDEPEFPADTDEPENEAQDGHARSWMLGHGNDIERGIEAACEQWLLARLEAALRAGAPPRALSVAELASHLTRIEGVTAVAAVVGGRERRDLAHRIAVLLQAHAVPYLAALRHTKSGLQKRATWERVWALQREQDERGSPAAIESPSSYRREDYRDAITWRHRGKLDVPTERFIAYPGAERDGEAPLYGWAGWDADQRAAVLATLCEGRRHGGEREPVRLTPLLAGILELVPWMSTRAAADEHEQHVAREARRLGLSVAMIQQWRPSGRAGR